MAKDIRGFAFFVGKTVKSVDSTAINSVRFNFTDGSQVIVDCDEQHLGIGVMQAKMSKPATKTKEKK